MAYYRIIETPGKKEVDVEEALGEKVPMNNLDAANAARQRLRALAKKEGRKVDFVVKRDESRAAASTGGATSIRVTEEQRKRVAKYVGRHMMETGETISLGDALVMMLDELDGLRAKVAKLEEEDEDE